MKCLYFLLFVAVAHGFVLDNARFQKADIDITHVTVILNIDRSITLEWLPVTSNDPTDPVLGYKVKVWETPAKKVLKYKYVDGVLTLVEEFEELPPFAGGDPTQEYVTDKTTFLIEAKPKVQYRIGLQAFTKTREGKIDITVIHPLDL